MGNKDFTSHDIIQKSETAESLYVETEEKNIFEGSCSCGETHEIKTQCMTVGDHVIENLACSLSEYNLPKNVMIVSDTNTYNAAGKRVANSLKDAGYEVAQHIFDSEKLIHPDEVSVGQLMFAMEPEPEMIVAVGSGTINDLCRFCACRIKIPYMVVATAPSMDGYASTVSPITRSGIKKTYNGIHPEAIVGDIDVLRKAPMKMLAAGFGDIVGKIPAQLDWMLGNLVLGEQMCEKVVNMTNSAVEQCMNASGELENRSLKAVEETMGALITSGVAMQMNGNSRPASGAEHHIAHFLEMSNTDRHNPDALHGANVGIASLITMRVYEKLFSNDAFVQGYVPNDEEYLLMIQKAYGKFAKTILDDVEFFFFDEVEREKHLAIIKQNFEKLQDETKGLSQTIAQTKTVLKACGGPTHPMDLGYSRETMYDAIKFARLIRTRYTILDFLDNLGQLDAYTQEILDELY